MNSDFNNVPQSAQPTVGPTNGPNYKKWVLGLLIAFVVIGGAFRLGYVSGSRGYTFNPKTFKVVNRGDSPAIVDYGLLWEALRIVQDKYIDAGNINPQEVLYGAIRGAISAAGDDYTEFFDPKTLADFKTELQGSFSGIGAEIGKRNENIVVVAPIEGSPAEKAGLRAKDILIKINDESTQEMTVDEAVSKIRGPEGTEVILNVYHEGDAAPVDIKIVRQKIEIKSVKLEYKELNGKSIAVIHLTRFGDDTKDLFKAAANDIAKNKPAAVVVDLRNDPGGYLETAVDVASYWLPQGTLVVKEEHSEKDIIDYNSLGYNLLSGFKTVVLINEGSASASEILAGALKDHGKASLVGTKSFGKGSVQELIPLGADAAVKVTVAKWITPNGKNLNKEGLEPDVKIELTVEDFTAGKDPQLDRALEEAIK